MQHIQMLFGVLQISDEDIDVVQADLHMNCHGYIYCSKMPLHLLIADRMKIVEAGKCIDHIDGNRCNNSRENLRCVVSRDNSISRHVLNTNNLSGYHGVSYKTNRNSWGVLYALNKPWAAYIKVNRKNYCIGMFTTQLEAASAYATVAELCFGEFHPKTILTKGERVPSAVAIATKYYMEKLNG